MEINKKRYENISRLYYDDKLLTQAKVDFIVNNRCAVSNLCLKVKIEGCTRCCGRRLIKFTVINLGYLDATNVKLICTFSPFIVLTKFRENNRIDQKIEKKITIDIGNLQAKSEHSVCLDVLAICPCSHLMALVTSDEFAKNLEDNVQLLNLG